MHQSTGLEYVSAYQDQALRAAAERRLAHQFDSHKPSQHRLVAAAVAVLLIVITVAVI